MGGAKDIPDPPVPENYFSTDNDFQCGEKRLALAIIEEAIGTYQRYAFSLNYRARRLHQEASDWIADSDRSWVFSFENLCDFLDLDPNYLRGGIQKWKQTTLRSMHKRSELLAAQ